MSSIFGQAARLILTTEDMIADAGMDGI